MDVLIGELTAGFTDPIQFGRIAFRLLAAALLGAIVGIERERTGKAAGLRTHMLVSLSSALFVMAPLDAGMVEADISRVVQGVAAGIGFLGAGAILKRGDEGVVQGLTTAAGIWMTAAVGVAVGIGRFAPAAMSVAVAWVILSVLPRLERQFER